MSRDDFDHNRYLTDDADAFGDTDLHIALDDYGAASRWPGGCLMTASERLATVSDEVRQCIASEMAGGVARRPVSNINRAPAEWFAGWGANAVGV